MTTTITTRRGGIFRRWLETRRRQRQLNALRDLPD
jgi:hypothetical protein